MKLIHFGFGIAVALVACNKKQSAATDDNAKPPASGSAASAPSAPSAPNAPNAPNEPGNGLAIKHVIPDFTGTYDNVFAHIVSQDNQTVIAFVRGCPQLTCEVGAWEAEQVKAVCPKAYIATIKVPSLVIGRFKLDVGFAGPADNISTGTLEEVRVELTRVEQDGVEGSASQETTESSVKGHFKAQVCPLT